MACSWGAPPSWRCSWAIPLWSGTQGFSESHDEPLAPEQLRRPDQGLPGPPGAVPVGCDRPRQEQHQEDQEDLDLAFVAVQERAVHRAIPRSLAYHSTEESPTNSARRAAPPRNTPY